MRGALRCIAALGVALAPASALGQVTTCAIVSAPGMGFGSYDDSGAAPTDSTTSVAVRCTRNGGPPDVNVTLGLGPSTNTGQTLVRRMQAGAEVLDYNLFRDAGRASVWGPTPGTDASTITLTGIANNTSRDATFVIYGRIPALQNAAVGLYSDAVTITLQP